MSKKCLFFAKLARCIKKLFQTILHILILIWSFSPILCLTQDSSFCEIRGGIKDKKNLRFSLLNIFFGSCFICIISFPIRNETKERFSLVKKLTIDKVIRENNKTLLKRENNVPADSNVEAHKEAAYYELQRVQSRIDVTQNKINNILSIGLVVIPILLTYLYKLLSRGISQLECIHRILLITGCAVCAYAILCIVFLLLKNLNRQTMESAIITYNKELDDERLVTAIRDDVDYETIKSLILTTVLLQIRKSLVILFISFVILVAYYIL